MVLFLTFLFGSVYLSVGALFLLISLSLFFLVNPAYAQGGFAVKGVIVDKTGFPLPGANVMEKGTSNGTITDLDGNFSLNVSKKGVTLTVSFMGYTPKDVVVKDRTTNITLEENSKLLDEVVVVGYGTMKKRDVTGAITSISSEAIEQKMATNVFEALQGTTAGVQVVSGSGQPGESSSIKIRTGIKLILIIQRPQHCFLQQVFCFILVSSQFICKTKSMHGCFFIYF